MTVTSIEHTVLIGNVIGDESTQNLDVNATMDTYVEKYRAALTEAFPNATIRLSTQLAGGADTYPSVVCDDEITGDMARERMFAAQNEAAERVLEIGEQVHQTADFWTYLEPAEDPEA